MFAQSHEPVMLDDRPGNTAADHSIVFIGSGMIFSKWILKVAAAECEAKDVVLFECFDCPAFKERFAVGPIHMLIVEDFFALDLVNFLETTPENERPQNAVVAYRNAEIARNFLALRKQPGPCYGLRFLPMNAPLGVWSSMLRMILMGDYFLPSELVDPGQEGAVPVQNRPLAKTRINAALTKRETEVLGLVAMGRRNKIIAHELGMSEHTVKLHLHHIITKLGVRNRTAATNWFLSRDDMGRG